MATKITYFAHSTTTDNIKGLSTGWAQGELSELGIQQAKELAQLVKDKNFDIIICSDLKRAIDSTNIVFAGHTHIVKDERLREANYGDLTLEHKSKFEPDTTYINQPFPNGESFKDVEKRIHDLLLDIKDKYNGKNIAFVAHRAPQLALDVIIKKITWEEAIRQDWREHKKWQPGWEYELKI
ncbi:histidine phosphatase family protein [Vallitalea okinawensis]|uniref:histidine phosphatase family protein n=1 Tax=Vallitalea okinawensis TaxID=2078660 RepID=UPI001300B311|nr:histidine phosphatase family protein [Vallitalea okinawensis]